MPHRKDDPPGVPYREGEVSNFGHKKSPQKSPAVQTPVHDRSPQGPRSPRRSPDPEPVPTKPKNGPADPDQIRATLINFYLCYAPHALTCIPALVTRYTNDGITLKSLVSNCRREFNNMLPVEREAQLCLEKDLRTRLYCFYAYYDWDMMEEVERIAVKYRGMDRHLFQALERKYGAEPMPPQLFSGATPAERKRLEEKTGHFGHHQHNHSQHQQHQQQRSLVTSDSTPNAGRDAPLAGELSLSDVVAGGGDRLSHQDSMRVLRACRVDLTRSWQAPPSSTTKAPATAKIDPDDCSLL
uniref:Uncharacterized protein n=2 Tax=Neobodo designis TaxID=312471 RepID=A0A7S1PUL8_NEODS|mmetsp:Transcript_20200/g.62765  ORF Transcript_20200/g.62765 Transcript_20200/m.62765 type:complete len:298 (+) Transcript_20200:32-925(+)